MQFWKNDKIVTVVFLTRFNPVVYFITKPAKKMTGFFVKSNTGLKRIK